MLNSKISAAILLLKSKAVETYGVINEMSTKNSEIGDAQEIANLALQLVQYEGAMITLQQYGESLQLAQPTPEPEEPPPEPEPAAQEPEGKTIVPTSENSPTFRNSQKNKYKKSKKKEIKDE